MFAELFWTWAPFMKQIQCLEESAESLRERSLKFYKGCRKYTYAYNFRFILSSLVYECKSLFTLN